MYEMELVFSISLYDKIFDVVSESLGTQRFVLKDAVEATITQTLPVIPSEEDIKKYAEAIKQGYKTARYVAQNVTFEGFKSIKEIDDPCTPKEDENV